MTSPIDELPGRSVGIAPSTRADGNISQSHVDESAPRIVVVTFPFASPAVDVLIEDFMSKIARVAPCPHLVAHLERQRMASAQWVMDPIPFKMHYSLAGRAIRSNVWWLAKLVAYQLIASLHLFRMRKLVDGAIFYMVGPYAPGPLLICKMFGIPTVMIVTESLEQETGGGSLVTRAVFGLRELSYTLSTLIAVESAALRRSPPLTNLNWKVLEFEVPRGTNFDDFRPVRPASRRPMSFGYVGRLTEQKGFLLFVQAASEVLGSNASASCIVVGTGPLEGEAESLALRHPESHVDYAPWTEHERVPEIMNSLRLLVLPSRTEGLPTVVVEAMACGTPVLATRVGGIGELIQEQETGFIVHDLDPRSLANAIESALTDPKLDAIAERARNLVTTRFADAIVESNLGRLVRSLVGQKTSGPSHPAA